MARRDDGFLSTRRKVAWMFFGLWAVVLVMAAVRYAVHGDMVVTLAVAAAAGIDGLPNTLIFSVGSDGTDGPTDAAGGLVTGEFAARCREKGLSIEKTLADNDAYNLLRQTDGLIVTGPTGTNVCDLTMLLVK